MTHKELLTVAIIFISPALCFSTAAYLAVHGVEGWGWFLFAGLLVSAARVKTTGDE